MDTDSDVRREVCASLVCLMETHPKHLMPQINQIIAYMLSSTRDEVVEVGHPPSTQRAHATASCSPVSSRVLGRSAP